MRALLATPSVQNPAGATLTAAWVAELRGVLRRAPDLLVFEDDHFGRLVRQPTLSLVELDRPRCAAVRSFSKFLGRTLDWRCC